MIFEMTAHGFTAELDYGTLHVSQHEGEGYRPYQLLVSSIAVCSGEILRNILGKMRVNVKDIKIQAETTRNPQFANRVERVHIHFMIRGNNLNEEKISKAVDLAKKNCPIVQSVIGSIEVIETFEMKKQ